VTETITVEYYKQKYGKKKKGLGRYPNIKRKRCELNHHHDSREEAEYCLKLQLLKRAGEIQDFRSQVVYSLDLTDEFGKKHHIANHRVDFEVTNKEGKTEIHEYKGVETFEWRMKRRLFEFIYPHIPYKVMREKDLLFR